jgi:tetratricopeptide (TPR) repeat protein
MIDYKQANALGKEALNLWGAGRLDEAADGYSRAIVLLEAGPPGCAYFHSALAGVLVQLGRKSEATEHYEKALQIELTQSDSEADASVMVARNFLADHLTKQGEAARSLEVLAPSVSALPNDWLVQSTQALALFALGRFAEARTAAEVAVANAGSESKREQLVEHLQAVFRDHERDHVDQVSNR